MRLARDLDRTRRLWITADGDECLVIVANFGEPPATPLRIALDASAGQSLCRLTPQGRGGSLADLVLDPGPADALGVAVLRIED